MKYTSYLLTYPLLLLQSFSSIILRDEPTMPRGSVGSLSKVTDEAVLLKASQGLSSSHLHDDATGLYWHIYTLHFFIFVIYIMILYLSSREKSVKS